MAIQNTGPGNIIVVGASAGGLNSIIELAAQLNERVNASAFIVLHIQHISSEKIILERLQRNTSFVCSMAESNRPIENRHLYLAIPDKHLVLTENRMVLGNGPQENRWRPSIDVLFRSAAAAFDSLVTGIILSGLMHDGTSGMIAIKRCGGTCIVQDPEEAEYPDMIRSVLSKVEVDYCVPLDSMGAILEEKTRNGKIRHQVPEDIMAEARIAERVALGTEQVEGLGERSSFSCPDCGGALFELNTDQMVRYRCYTGHVYNQEELLVRQTESLENTLWIALRMLEERKNLLEKMSREEMGKGWKSSALSKAGRASELEGHINRLKELLFRTK